MVRHELSIDSHIHLNSIWHTLQYLNKCFMSDSNARNIVDNTALVQSRKKVAVACINHAFKVIDDAIMVIFPHDNNPSRFYIFLAREYSQP